MLNLIYKVIHNKQVLILAIILLTVLIISSLLMYSQQNKKTLYTIAYIGVGESSSDYNKFNRWLLQKRLDEINRKSKKIKLELFAPSTFNRALITKRIQQLKDNKLSTKHIPPKLQFNNNVTYAFREEKDDQKYGLIADFYSEILTNKKDVILVIDNTWGRHLETAIKAIKNTNIPVISLNGDRGTHNNFNNNVLFLGSSDNTPKTILNYITQVLKKESVIFITENSYKLSSEFITAAEKLKIEIKNTCYINEKNYKKTNKQIIEEIKCLDLNTKQSNGSAINFVIDNIRNANDKPVLILNVHSLIGNALIRELNHNSNKKLQDLNVIGGAYIVGSNEDFPTNNTKLLLLTNPLDAVPKSIHHDIKLFFEENTDVKKLDIDNIPLFSERIYLASEIINFAINNKSKLDQFPKINCQLNKDQQINNTSFGCILFNKVNVINNKANKKEASIILKNSELANKASTSEDIREIYKNTFLNIKQNKHLIVSDQVLDFDDSMRLKPNLSFEQRYKNKITSNLYQMNNNYVVIPNFIFGVTNLDIISINQEDKSFTAEFLVWINSPIDLFQHESTTDFNTQKDKTKSLLSKRSQEAFGALAEVVRLDNLIEYLDIPYTIAENHNEEEGIFSYIFRIKGNFHTYFKYKDFPFDEQELIIKINLIKSPNEVRVSNDRASIAYERAKFIKIKNISGWQPKDYYYTVDRTRVDFPSDEKRMSYISNRTFQSINLRLPIERLLMKPLILVITPMLMIGLAAISVLYLKKLTFEGAGEVSVVIFLALITYSLSIKDVVPAIETTTMAHILFFITFALVVIVFLYIVFKNSYFYAYDLSDNTGKKSYYISAFITISYFVAVFYTLVFY